MLSRFSSWLYVRGDIADTSMTRFEKTATRIYAASRKNQADITFIAYTAATSQVARIYGY